MIKTVLMSLLLTTAVMAQDVFTTFNVKAEKEAKLVLSATGLVKKVYVDIGDKVKKGQLLLELDNSDLKTSVQLAQKKIELAEINLRFAKKSYDRYAKVKEVVDESEFEKYASAYERAKVELSKAKANLAYNQSLLNKTRLKAPFSGVIASKNIEVGDGVSAARMGTLFSLVTPKQQKMVVMVDEKYWKQLKVGQRFVYSVDGDKTKHETKIKKIYPVIDSKRRAITVEMPTKGLQIGLFGRGVLKVD